MENDIEIKEQKKPFFTKEKLRKILGVALPLAVILGCFATVVYYILGPAEGYFHSDCTDTILWAQASYDSGKLISNNFQYAALLPFGGNLLMLPFIPIFGVSMTTHNIGMVLFALLFFLSLYALARSLGYDLARAAVLIFTVTLTLSGSDKLREIMWGHVIYYSLGILFLAFGLSLVNRAVNRGSLLSVKGRLAKDIILLAGLFVFSAATATNGLQSVVTYILPVAGALILERIFAEAEDKNSFLRKVMDSTWLLLILLASALVGIVILKLVSGGVSAGYANAYSAYSGMSSWRNNLLKFGEAWFSLIGVNVADGDSFLSISAMGNLIRIFFGIFILVFPIICAFMYKKITSRGARLVLLSHFVQSALIMFAYIFGRLNSANWRLTPMLGSAIIACTVCALELIKPQGFTDISKRFAALALCLICLAPAVSAAQILKMPADYGRDNDLHRITAELESRGLTNGYAEFWKSQAVTLLSDSKVKVRNIQIVDSKIEKYTYQSEYTWYEDQPEAEKYFILLSDYEYSILQYHLTLKYPDADIQTFDGYKILILQYNPFSK